MSRVLPILFNTDMVRAILDGRKTVTRRVIKLPDGMSGRPIGDCRDPDNPLGFMNPCGIKRPPYDVGDIMYVLETWCLRYDGEKYFYKADKNTPREEKRFIDYDHVSWKPSIHMPKEAARIWLKVKDVRVERLQEITEEQALAEGAIDNRAFVHSPDNEHSNIHSAKEHFAQIWNSTIKKSDIDRYGWDANPWVWVIEFERCEKPDI